MGRVITTRSLALAVACAVLVGTNASCYATAEPVPLVYDGYYGYGGVPANFQGYPYVYYNGAPNYYVGGRWYRQTPQGWGYYRTEPSYLYSHRPYVQQAPPAYRYSAPPAYRGPGYSAPPAYNHAPPAYNHAPPAMRVH